MPFLPPNQQRQITEGTTYLLTYLQKVAGAESRGTPMQNAGYGWFSIRWCEPVFIPLTLTLGGGFPFRPLPSP